MDLKCAGKLKDVLFAEKSYDSYTIQLVVKQFYRKVFDVRRNLSMSEIKHESINNIPQSHKCEHEGYEYYRRKFVPFGGAKNTLVSVYEIHPKKAAYPYAEIGLEPDHRKDTAIWCELTFRAVEFLHIIESMKQ